MPRVAVFLSLCLALVGCAEEESPPLGVITHPLEAYCTATVTGVGERAVETDYLPHVVCCENGGADLEALKAQAVAARSYLYYKLARSGSIADGTSDQVYSCARCNQLQPQHIQAAAETSGQILTYHDTLVAAFYVAGAIPTTETCIPADGDSDPTNTERFVTYNRGRSGDTHIQTSLGWIDPGNYANRGCKSQNGAHCLAEHGVGYRDILTFYYGEDIVLTQATGNCVEEPPLPDAAPPPPPDAAPPPPDAAPPPPPDAAPPDAAPPPDTALSDQGETPDALPNDSTPDHELDSARLDGGCQQMPGSGWPLALLALALLKKRRPPQKIP